MILKRGNPGGSVRECVPQKSNHHFVSLALDILTLCNRLATLQSHYMAARMLWNFDMGSDIDSMGGSNSPGYIVPKRESLFAQVKIHNE